MNIRFIALIHKFRPCQRLEYACPGVSGRCMCVLGCVFLWVSPWLWSLPFFVSLHSVYLMLNYQRVPIQIVFSVVTKLSNSGSFQNRKQRINKRTFCFFPSKPHPLEWTFKNS